MKKLLLIVLIIMSILLISACSAKAQKTETSEAAQPNQTNGGTASDDTVDIQILVTSDTHGKFLPYDYAQNIESKSGSMAQVATAVKELKNDNTIIIDAGDVIQGNSSELFLSDDIHPMILSMNEIGYDFCAIGNHEFNYGVDTLKKIMSQNNAFYLCGNVYNPDGTHIAEGYTVVERCGVKIGIIGMVSPNIMHWDSENLKGYTVTDPVEETKKIINILRPEVDVLIAVEHMMMENELGVPNSGIEDLANACGELDLIIAAHGHQLIEGEKVNGVPIIENKDNCATLSKTVISMKNNGDKWSIDNIDINSLDMVNYDPDAELSEKLMPYHKKALVNLEQKIGVFEDEYLVAPDEITGIPRAQIEDSALIDLINDVMMHYSKAKVSGTSLLDSKSNLYKGDILNRDISLIYKYGNTLYTLKMNGAQLKKWMEWSASYYNTYKDGDLTVSFNPEMRQYNYDMFSGVNYEIDISKDVGSRIVNLTWPDGTPVDDNEEFFVATTNYRATGMLTSYGTVFEEGDSLPQVMDIDVCGNIGGIRDLIKDYISNVKGGVLKASCDNNWRIIGNNWDESLHKQIAVLVNEGKLKTVSSDDGRTPNVKSFTVDDLN